MGQRNDSLFKVGLTYLDFSRDIGAIVNVNAIFTKKIHRNQVTPFQQRQDVGEVQNRGAEGASDEAELYRRRKPRRLTAR